MRIDFHTHSVLTKALGFDWEFFNALVGTAGTHGIDALVITEHFNTTRFDDVWNRLDRELEYDGSWYAAGNVRVCAGMEVDVAENVHVLVFGGRDGVRNVRAGLDDHLEEGKFIPFRTLQSRARAVGLYLNCAHPLRPGHEVSGIADLGPGDFDLFDLNARDLFFHGPGMRAQVSDLAVRYGVPLVAGSDTHHHLQLGSLWTEVEGDPQTLSELMEIVRSGRHRIEISPCLDTKVEAARIVKELLKQRLLAS